MKYKSLKEKWMAIITMGLFNFLLPIAEIWGSEIQLFLFLNKKANKNYTRSYVEFDKSTKVLNFTQAMWDDCEPSGKMTKMTSLTHWCGKLVYTAMLLA